MKRVTNNKYYLLIILFCLLYSCKKFVEVDSPKDEVVRAAVFSNDQTAVAAIRGIYTQMATSGIASGSFQGISIVAGNSADEYISLNSSLDPFYHNSIPSTDAVIKSGLWDPAYSIIYSANAALEGLDNSTSISASVKKQLSGEAKFVRAFIHFYLVNLFGDVPLVISTDYKQNSIASRASTGDVYDKIISDLTEAEMLLSDDYSWSNGEKVRVNKFAATAMLARVHLYNKDWVNAEIKSSEVLDNSQYALCDDLNGVFLANSTEAIWQLRPLDNQNTNDALYLIPSAEDAVPGFVTLTGDLYNSFESGDERKVKWIGHTTAGGAGDYYYPYKYKIRTPGAPQSEYSMVLRLSEQYLIRAEARINLNKVAEGVADINILRTRARGSSPGDLPPISDVVSAGEALEIIIQERNHELFSEWGHRWFDIKRWNKANELLAPVKSGDWQNTDQLYPIPQAELDRDINLTQNEGYQ